MRRNADHVERFADRYVRMRWAGALIDPTVDLFRPYLVADSAVAAVSRHPEISGQVWSAAQGYPGDPFYREFHRKDDRSGLRGI